MKGGRVGLCHKLTERTQKGGSALSRPKDIGIAEGRVFQKLLDPTTPVVMRTISQWPPFLLVE